MFATVAVIRRASDKLVTATRISRLQLTVADVQDNRATDKQSNNLHCITDRLELSRHGGAESHVANNDGRERVDDTIRNSSGCEQSVIWKRVEGIVSNLRGEHTGEEQYRLGIQEP